MPERTPVRAEVLFRGHVQGVGFRYRTLMVAERFDVEGYVRNLRNGTVEVVVEGGKAQVEGFLDAVRERLGGFVTDDTCTWTEPQGGLRGFGVRY